MSCSASCAVIPLASAVVVGSGRLSMYRYLKSCGHCFHVVIDEGESDFGRSSFRGGSARDELIVAVTVDSHKGRTLRRLWPTNADPTPRRVVTDISASAFVAQRCPPIGVAGLKRPVGPSNPAVVRRD